jgi:hypothetical protein
VLGGGRPGGWGVLRMLAFLVGAKLLGSCGHAPSSSNFGAFSLRYRKAGSAPSAVRAVRVSAKRALARRSQKAFSARAEREPKRGMSRAAGQVEIQCGMTV